MQPFPGTQVHLVPVASAAAGPDLKLMAISVIFLLSLQSGLGLAHMRWQYPLPWQNKAQTSSA